MKTIGMIGGMSWESSSVYYQIINREIQKRLGGVHSAKCLMYSVDFGEMAKLQSAGRWREAGEELAAICRSLAGGGADFAMLCCNTMHLVFDAMEKTGVPLLHIADPLGKAIKRDGFHTVGLIGTRYTMEEGGVISDRLAQKFGLDVLTPDKDDRDALHRIIYEELTRGNFNDESRAACAAIMEKLVRRGAQGIILGCTEFPILLKAEHASVPLYDTATLHALSAVDIALS